MSISALIVMALTVTLSSAGAFAESEAVAQRTPNPAPQTSVQPKASPAQIGTSLSDAAYEAEGKAPTPTPAPTPLPKAAAHNDAIKVVLPTTIGATVSPLSASADHQLIRRVVVFPMIASEDMKDVGDDTWWDVRETLTRSRRFLVASKQFLLKNDAFQPRGILEPADAIILGRLLDAHALVTMQLKDRTLTMAVYDATNGYVLWQKDFKFHPSIPVRDQMVSSARKMIEDFMASVPYQAYQVVDPLIGRAVYEQGNLTLAQIDIGFNSNVQVGDVAQWIRLSPTPQAPLFQGGAHMTIYAEGRVLRINQNVATIEVQRASRRDLIKENSLVRLPREAERMQNEFLIRQMGVKSPSDLTLLTPEADPMQTLRKERRPLVTTGSIIVSIAAFLLLAF
jgi:hypothetical protein